MLRRHPAVDIDLLALNAARRFKNFAVLPSADAEFTLSMRRNFGSDHSCPEVGDIAKKLNWALFVAIFHLAIRRTHPAERLNATFDTLSHPRAFPTSQLEKRLFPHAFRSGFLNSERLLLRYDTNAHLSVGIDSE